MARLRGGGGEGVRGGTRGTFHYNIDAALRPYSVFAYFEFMYVLKPLMNHFGEQLKSCYTADDAKYGEKHSRVIPYQYDASYECCHDDDENEKVRHQCLHRLLLSRKHIRKMLSMMAASIILCSFP